MKVKLETFLTEISNKTEHNNQYPVLTSSKDGLFLQNDYFNKQVASIDNTGYKIIRRGQFTYRAMSDTGRFYPNELECTDIGIVSPAYPVFEIAKPEMINSHFLKYYFKSNVFQHQISGFAQGSTRTSIKFNKLKTVFIDLPSIENQNQVVESLDSVKKIIDIRVKQIQLLDDLIKARFVELFGDLNINNMGWDEKPLLDVCNQLKRYPTFCNMEYIEHGTRVIRIGNILLDGHMDIDEANYVFVYDTVNDDFPDTVIEKYDIVMAVRGDGSAAKRIGIIQEDRLIGANISPNLIRIQANPNIVDPIFLFYYLTGEVGQNRLDTYVNKTAKKNIAAKDIAKVITPIPDMELQKEYVGFVKQVDKSKVTIQESLDKTQILFNSLMQKYFG